MSYYFLPKRASLQAENKECQELGRREAARRSSMDWREKFRNWWNSIPNEQPIVASSPEEDDVIDPYDPFPEPVRVPLSDVFDLHTIQPAQTKVVVATYLEDARAAGYRSVRLIHGKGIGVQRATVRSVLAATPFVDTFTDAPPEAGGWGATIAFFKR